jgi:hypothetical protein
MDESLASAALSDGRSVHIATLSRETIVANAADHLGFGGYFVFETGDDAASRGISILAKVVSLDAAFRMIDIWSVRPQIA